MMFSGQQFVLNIASSIANPNIPVIAAAAGWDGASRVIVNITAPYVNAINLQSGWSFPRGIEMEISAGTLVGGNRIGLAALTAAIPVSIRNLGSINGAGGGGGTGGQSVARYQEAQPAIAGYGGAGGGGQGFDSAIALTPSGAAPGEAGTYELFSGSVFGGDVTPWAQGGTGGDGGLWGQDGGAGGYGYSGGTRSSYTDLPPQNGGPAGKAVVGNSNITWLATGTRIGAVT